MVKVAKARAKRTATSKKPDKTAALLERIAFLEEAVDRLKWSQFYGQSVRTRRRSKLSLAAAQDKYIPATSDGWLNVKINNVISSLPSGLKVAFTNSSSGRDYATVSEGVLAGTDFDVKSGNLVDTYTRFNNLQITVAARSGGPVVIDGESYDLDISLSYKDGSASKSAGPFPALTDPANPLPWGKHPVEIADFPHDKGLPYKPHGTVWFRLGTTGDRYLHPGKVSNGCMTCAPPNWTKIFQIVHCSRKDSKTAGELTYSPAAAVAASGGRRRKARVAA